MARTTSAGTFVLIFPDPGLACSLWAGAKLRAKGDQTLPVTPCASQVVCAQGHTELQQL